MPKTLEELTDYSREVTYRAANGHTMVYFARTDDPKRPAPGASFEAWCAPNCTACREGDPLPDW